MKKSGAIILIIVLTLVLTGVFLVVFPKIDAMNQQTEKTQEEEPEEETTYSYTIEDAFITNIKDSKRYVKASIAIEVTSEEVMTELEAQEYIIKDTVLKILRTTTEEEFKSPDTQDVLSEVIKEELITTLGLEDIKKIYFMELVVQ
jgi:flagellar FliL protein